MTHKLSLEVSDASNPKVMRVFDTSYYCDETIENYLIEVLAVNRTSWVSFIVQKNFSLTLNSSNLGYKLVNQSSDLTDLQDGIYEFKQSYKPNIHTLKKYYHLRITELYGKIRTAWDELIDEKCDISRAEFNVNRDKLREIEEYLLAAKYKVEECHDKDKGKELYDWAETLLEQYTNECQC